MAKDFQIGTQYGPYVVQEVIAQGGQGVVLRTTHAQHNVQVALKLLFDNSDLSRRRFVREIETLRTLEHPRLPRAFDLGEHEGTLFVALELIEGQSLRDLVKVGGPLPEARAVEIVHDIARTVAHCHAKGVLHRDLKPANVILRASDNNPIVVDFGIVKVEGKGVSDQSRLSLTGELIGTPAFMAPEQADGAEGIGPPADVYGVAVILYYLLCGEQPYTGETAYNVLSALALAPTPDVRSVNPAVPANLAEFLLRAMAKDPKDRPQTILAFAGELDQALRAPPPQEAKTRPRWLLPLALAGVGILLPVAAFLASQPTEGPAGTPSPSRTTSTEPQASATPAPSFALPSQSPPTWVDAELGPPGSVRWEFSLDPERGFTGTLDVVGPHVSAPHGPLNPAGTIDLSRVKVARLTRGAGKHVGSAADATHLAWDSPRDRLIFVFKDELMSLKAEAVPRTLAPAEGVRALEIGPRTIYLSRANSLDVLSAEGKRLTKLAVAGDIECRPLLLNVESKTPGLDRVLVPTTGSQLHLLDLRGRPLSVLDLPGPVAFTPTLLRGSGRGPAEVLLTSGAGVLTRVSVSAEKLQILGSVGLVRGAHPIGPALVDRTTTGAPRRIYVPTQRDLLCLNSELDTLEWSAGLRGRRLKGIQLADFDRDGVQEVLASFEKTPGKGVKLAPRTSQAVFDGEGLLRFRSETLPGPGSARPLGSDSVLVQVGARLQAWGPWESLPPARTEGVLQTRDRPLPAAPGVKVRSGKTARVMLSNSQELAPFEIRFDRGPTAGLGNGVRGQGVFSAYILRSDLGGRNKHQLGKGSRYEISFMLEESVDAAYLEIDVKIPERNGPGFGEVMVGVDERYLSRTRQIQVGRSTERFRLGALPKGGVTIKVAISPRSELRMRLLGARLFPSE